MQNALCCMYFLNSGALWFSFYAVMCYGCLWMSTVWDTKLNMSNKHEFCFLKAYNKNDCHLCALPHKSKLLQPVIEMLGSQKGQLQTDKNYSPFLLSSTISEVIEKIFFDFEIHLKKKSIVWMAFKLPPNWLKIRREILQLGQKNECEYLTLGGSSYLEIVA